MAERNMVQRSGPVVKLEEGKTLEGHLLDIQQGSKSQIFVVKPEGGEAVRFWGCAQLDSALTRDDVGKFVSVTFKGLVQREGKDPMNEYVVAVEAPVITE